MKKLLTLLTLFCCFSIAMQAQSKSGTYGLQVEAGYAFNITENNNYSRNDHQAWNIAVSPGYHITDKLFAGIGVALYDYHYNRLISNVYGNNNELIEINTSFISVPIFAHGLWKFRIDNKPSWFVSLKVGYGIISKSTYPKEGQASSGIIRDDYSGGLFASPSVGYMYPINNKHAISLSVSYDLQKNTITNITDDDRPFKSDKTNSTIAVKVGWTF